MDSVFERIVEGSNLRTQIELAKCLLVSPASISAAKRRKVIPSAWLIILLKKFNLNPEWIVTGEGLRYLVESSHSLGAANSSNTGLLPLKSYPQEFLSQCWVLEEKLKGAVLQFMEQGISLVEAEIILLAVVENITIQMNSRPMKVTP